MTDGPYHNLQSQYHRWRRRHNRNSYATRERYDSSMSVFIHFLADEFRLQKLANIKPKHVFKFVQKRLSDGISPSTLTTDLSSIRLFLDQYDELRCNPQEFPSNEDLRNLFGMPKRKFGGVARAWALKEFEVLVALAYKMGRPTVAQALALAFWAGLRLHEVIQIDHARIQRALENGYISIKGKGNKWRDVPICEEAKLVLLEALQHTRRGERAFVENRLPVHKQMASIQKFILNHRHKIESHRPVSRAEMLILGELGVGLMQGPLTFHGLRHSFAMRQYHACRQKGMTPLDARLHVSRLLGHERDDVTRIYLAGVAEFSDCN